MKIAGSFLLNESLSLGPDKGSHLADILVSGWMIALAEAGKKFEMGFLSRTQTTHE